MSDGKLDLPRGKVGEDRIEIAAPAEVVWKLIEDVPGWTAWNPVYREAEGTLTLGDTVKLLVAIPGMKPQRIAVPVVKLEPGAHVQYGAPSLGGLVCATRYVDVRPLTTESCVVRNGEVMSGALGRALGPWIGPKILDALRQMNQGLKSAAESEWLARR